MFARWEILPERAVLEHVEPTTPDEAVVYLGVVALWMLGVIALIVRKLRAA